MYPTRFLRAYARGKLRSDPMYGAVAEVLLQAQSAPLFDLGCGVGLLAFYLREAGIAVPIVGLDHDGSKIRAAAAIARRYSGIEFKTGDARERVPPGMNVAALDILHYFTDAEQDRILESIAAAIPPGGVAVIRDGVRDESLRFRLTVAQETFSRVIRWLKAERLHFPTRDRIAAPFRRLGFSEEVTPMWGNTPFNNYLFVFRSPGGGTTQA